MHAKCRVLILDDNAGEAESLAEVIKIKGHDVRVCYAAVDALEVAAAFKPDVCILDIGLPDFDGRDVARALRAMCGPGQLLIALSGHVMARDVAAAARMAGFDHYLGKPADVNELLALFRSPAE
jgi:DNA-binding response OmpR family regulator